MKVGVIYVKENQSTEEEFFANNEHSNLFDEFLTILGEKVRLKGKKKVISNKLVFKYFIFVLPPGFDRYKGGLDTVHDLTGLHSVSTLWRNIEIMFHVSTLLPYEANDAQKVRKNQHILSQFKLFTNFY